MADSNFKVRYGLEVAGDASLTGDLTVSGNDIKMSGGTTALTFSGTGDVAVAGDLQVSGNDVKMAGGTTALTFSGSGDVAVAGDLTVTGNDIKSSTGTPITLNGNDVTIAGDLAVNGGDITTNQTTFNLVNTTATTLNIGGAATTAVNIGNSSGQINTPSDVDINGNKSLIFGSGYYSASTDIYRDNAGNAAEGILVSNNNMTSANSVLVNRVFGETTPGGTSTTAIPGQLALQGSRGTQSVPLATNSNNAIGAVVGQGNYGTIGGGGSGLVFANDLYPYDGSTGGISFNAIQNFRQTAGATFTGSISGTTLTVTAVASGTITPGTEIRGTGFSALNAGYVITRQLTTTAAANALGNTGTYELNVSPGTIGSSTMNTYSITGASSTRIWSQPSNTVQGQGTGTWPASPNTTLGLLMSGNSITANHGLLTLSPAFFTYPVLDRIVTSITGGNTLVLGNTPNITSAYIGSTIKIITAGDPNGLITATTYFIDTVPTPNQITLRTNSVSGGAVTGLTNGTGLFIRIQIISQGFQTTVPNFSQLTLSGPRQGFNFNTLNPVSDPNRQNDNLGRISFSGSSGLGVGTTGGFIAMQCTEDWTGALNTGSQFNFSAQKTAGGGTFVTNIGPNTTNFRTDAFNVINTSGTTNLAIASNGNTTVTGTLRVNGNQILTGGNNIVMSFDNAATATRLNGVVTFGRTNNFGDLYQATLTPGGMATGSVLKLNSASAAATQTSDLIFGNYRFDGTNLSPAQNNDLIGGFKFVANTASSGSTPSDKIAVGFNATATENWTPTANGSKFTLTATKIGTTTTAAVIEGSLTNTIISSDSITLESSAGTDMAIFTTANTQIRSDNIEFKDSAGTLLTRDKLDYTRTYGEFAYVAGTITPAAPDTIYAFPLDTTNMASGVTISNTSRVNINIAGIYKIIMSLQVKNADNANDHLLRFWLRKNGADVTNSATLVTPLKLQEQVISMDWLVESDGNDYWEIVYYVNDTDVTFPFYANITTPVTAPAAPPIIVNVLSVGA